MEVDDPYLIPIWAIIFLQCRYPLEIVMPLDESIIEAMSLGERP